MPTAQLALSSFSLLHSFLPLLLRLPHLILTFTVGLLDDSPPILGSGPARGPGNESDPFQSVPAGTTFRRRPRRRSIVSSSDCLRQAERRVNALRTESRRALFLAPGGGGGETRAARRGVGEEYLKRAGRDSPVDGPGRIMSTVVSEFQSRGGEEHFKRVGRDLPVDGPGSRVVQKNSIFLDSATYLVLNRVFHAESKYRRKKKVRSAVLVRRRF